MTTDFGRRVLYYIHGRRGGDLRGRWTTGIWVGKAFKTDEHLILDQTGVNKCRAVRRHVQEKRWSAEWVRQVKGLP